MNISCDHKSSTREIEVLNQVVLFMICCGSRYINIFCGGGRIINAKQLW